MRSTILYRGVSILGAVVLSACGSDATPSSPSGEPSVVQVYVGGEDGVDTFRIPTITRTWKGTLLAFADAKLSGPHDIGPKSEVLKRSSDGGRSWSPLQYLQRFEDQTAECQASNFPLNPLVPLAILEGRHAGDVIVITVTCGVRTIGRSTDDGLTWTFEPMVISGNATIPTSSATRFTAATSHGIQLRQGPRRGRLVYAAYGTYSGRPLMLLVVSDDGGATWHIGATGLRAPARGVGEVSITELSDGTILGNTRTSVPFRAEFRSLDGGDTFVADEDGGVTPQAHGITGAPAAAGLMALPNCDELIFAGVADRSVRRGLRLWRSLNRGATWHPGPLLLTDPAAYADLVLAEPGANPVYGALVETGPNNSNEGISFVRFRDDDIKDAPDPLPTPFDVATLASGFIEIGEDRYRVARFCIGLSATQRIEVDGGTFEFDPSAGFDRVRISGTVTTPEGTDESYTGFVMLDSSAGYRFGGTVTDTRGTQHVFTSQLVNYGFCGMNTPAQDLSDPITTEPCEDRVEP